MSADKPCADYDRTIAGHFCGQTQPHAAHEWHTPPVYGAATFTSTYQCAGLEPSGYQPDFSGSASSIAGFAEQKARAAGDPWPPTVTAPAKCPECGGSQVVEVGLPDIYESCPACVTTPEGGHDE